MVNRVLHIAKFSGGGSKQPMRQGLVWPVVVEGSIREFGHGFESRIDQVSRLLVMSNRGRRATARQVLQRTSSPCESYCGLRMRVKGRLKAHEIQRRIGLRLFATTVNGTIEKLGGPIASEEFE